MSEKEKKPKRNTQIRNISFNIHPAYNDAGYMENNKNDNKFIVNETLS